MENTITHFINQNLDLDFLNVKTNLKKMRFFNLIQATYKKR